MRPMMNEHTESLVTRIFAVIAAIAAAMGMSTQDLFYIFFAGIGALISVCSFICGRIDARHAKRENIKRTAIVAEYVEDAKNSGHNPAALAVLVQTLEKVNKK